MKMPTNADGESGAPIELGSTEPERVGDELAEPVDPTQVHDDTPDAPPEGDEPEDPTEALSTNKAREAVRRSRGIPSVPHHEIVRFLGAGTFGEVWLARDRRTGIRVAIKFFHHGSGGQWGLLQSEVQQLAQLHADPGIVQLVDVEPEATPPYYVMAFVENGSLAQRLERDGPLPLHDAVEIFRQLAEALAYVHAKGIRHCDLKPSNVLLDARGRARIADFGQAHLSSDASPALGTFFYMAPEQADLDEQIADTRWDVYALGAILYAMLTGHPPREDPALRAEITGTAELSHRLKRYRDWVRSAPRPKGHRRVPGIDRFLVAILDRCLEVDPEKRLRDAGAVLEALARRRRALRQRAMLGFGLIAPVALMLAMAALTLAGADQAILASQDAMAAQLCRSDAVTARLAALVVEDEFRDRLGLLEGRVADPRLGEAARRGDIAAIQERLAEYGHEAEAEQVDVVRWTVADRGGTTLANYPHDPSVCGRNWAWRDWFNGRGDQVDAKGEAYPPVDRPHVSQPFVGKARQQRLGVVLSAPIYDPGAPASAGEGRIVGVLALTIELEKVRLWLDSVRLNDGFAVLVDDRYHCVLHDRQDRVRPAPDRNPPVWESPVYRRLIGEKRAGQTLSYRDPVDGKVYLAGFAPVETIGWGVIVQHHRDRVLAQIAAVTYRLLRIGRVALVAAGLLISALWGWQFWTLRRAQRMADA